MTLSSSCLILGLVLYGCGGSAVSVVRVRAASDLRCTASELLITPPQADGYPFIAEGCGEIGRYIVSYCNGLAGCTVTDAQIVSEVVATQAAFDLQCTKSEIAIAVLGRDTFGARGCGRQASYLLAGCREGACKVVQNTAQNR